MPGTWRTISNPPPQAVATTLLLTDGTVLAQGVSTNEWYRLTPDASGDYGGGTWATMASSVHAPLYYASGVLRDGRVIVVGGEYDDGALVWLLGAEMYNPVANTWTTLPTPAGWTQIGDAPGCVLPDGRFFVGQVGTRKTAIYDPATNAWTAAADKINTVSEESWSLLPDGSIHAVDCSNPPNAEKYVIAANTWVPAGATPDVLVDGISEIGASTLLPDGRLFVIGATGFTALYTPPPIANQPGTWVAGPTIPQSPADEALGTVDAPACVMPNGKVLFTAGPITIPPGFHTPTYAFEYDPLANVITGAPAPANAPIVPYKGRMLMLPSGEVLYTACSTTVELYTPSGGPDPVWVPTITGCPTTLRRNKSFLLAGRQINGVTQGAYYGNDATEATNYPLVRLESTDSDSVYYCRTSEFSTMGLQTGTIVHTCRFRLPGMVPNGTYCLVVVVNGIASACHRVGVTHKRFKELKLEIKEKSELIDSLRLKRVPDIDDIKGIREEIKLSREGDVDIVARIEEEWIDVVKSLASNVDLAFERLSHAFITAEERPEVGPPPPEKETLNVRRISEDEARRSQEKQAFADDRDELAVSEEAEEFHERLHAVSRSGGKAEFVFRRSEKAGKATKATKAKKVTKATKAAKLGERAAPPPQTDG